MKLLILSDIPPCTNYTAGIVMNKWCDFLLEEGHKIFFALVMDPNLDPIIPKDKINKIEFLKINKPKEIWNREEKSKASEILNAFRSFLDNNSNRIYLIPKIAKKISIFSKQNECSLMFASVQGQTITQLVRRVSRKSSIDYVAQTWDPLEWWLKQHRFDFISSYINKKEFAKMAKGARCFGAMSWAMSKEFEKEYGVKCVTNIPSLESGKLSKVTRKKNNRYVIGYAGQLYATEEFDVLVAALNELGWNYKGKDIVINLYGSYFDGKYHTIKGIKIYPHINQDKLLSILAKSDLLYCPYWFSNEFEYAARISFPSKLTTYLKTGVPILIHAPEYASPRIFLESNNAAYLSDSLEVKSMLKKIKEIIDSHENNEYVDRGYELFEKYLTYDQMKKSLLVSLGLVDRKEIQEFESFRKIF